MASLQRSVTSYFIFKVPVCTNKKEKKREWGKMTVYVCVILVNGEGRRCFLFSECLLSRTIGYLKGKYVFSIRKYFNLIFMGIYLLFVCFKVMVKKKG